MSGLMGALKYFSHLGDLSEVEEGSGPPGQDLLLLEDGSSFLILEDGSGFLALES